MKNGLTKAQSTALQELRDLGEWVTAWRLGRQERVLDKLVDLGFAERDCPAQLGRPMNYYKAL